MTSTDPATGILDATRPLGVYVHFPFCRARCPYCDFATAVREPIPHDEYAAAVIAELSARSGWFRGERAPDLKSIYFGGGTPGLWRAEAIGRVIEDHPPAFRCERAAGNHGRDQPG
jgi:coproporphyrinogen III oxidase-like Fe-S oxidoreductase